MRLRLPHKRAPRNQAGARRETLGRIGFRAVREGVRVIGLVGAGWRNKVSDHEDSPMYSPLGSGMGRAVGGEPVERCFRSWGDQWSSLVLPAVAVS